MPPARCNVKSARLILVADDFGLTPGINRAVIKLHNAGCLTSATLMAAGAAFKEAAALARDIRAIKGCEDAAKYCEGISAFVGKPSARLLEWL